ncbi:MAG: C4-dicarboxylate ABC transporter permease, partial [Tateyamaria sp.]
MENDNVAETGGSLAALADGVIWFVQSLVLGFYNILYAITHPASWLDWLSWANTTEDKESLMRFVYYGGSTEFFFAVLAVVVTVIGVGIWRNAFMWGCVRVLEGI